MTSELIVAEYRKIQQAAKEVLAELAATICPHDTEFSIAQRAQEGLCSRGLPETWYYDCPALVLLGTRSCLSISGREYQPALEPVGPTNLVTVDLSPRREAYWGDCARSFFIERGRNTVEPALAEFSDGKRFLESLQAAMIGFVQPDTTFHQLFEFANGHISLAGFENLDFRGNIGHSIAARREDRKYTKSGNRSRLSDVPFFTFEPHVRTLGGRWGFKHENIFFFNAYGRLEEL